MSSTMRIIVISLIIATDADAPVSLLQCLWGVWFQPVVSSPLNGTIGIRLVP